jgi:mono/diheme cytochrome c family protein
VSYGSSARVLIAAAVLSGISWGTARGDQAALDRGKYVFDAGGCSSCHTDAKAGGARLAGGPAIKTPFGTFYAPNISPDTEFGVGRWTDRQFLRALREGVGPDGRHYYPAFPYTTYTRATERDLLDLKAYLFAQPPVAQASRPHAVEFPFSIRPLLWFWKLLNFDSVRWRPDATRSETWNRGSYLVEALSHCGECHTPRNFLGGLDRSRWMAGARLGDGETVTPNLTPHERGLAEWSESDITFALDFGITPEGEPFGGEMGEVVGNSTSRLTAADRTAIAIYLKALPALPSAVRRKSE